MASASASQLIWISIFAKSALGWAVNPGNWQINLQILHYPDWLLSFVYGNWFFKLTFSLSIFFIIKKKSNYWAKQKEWFWNVFLWLDSPNKLILDSKSGFMLPTTLWVIGRVIFENVFWFWFKVSYRIFIVYIYFLPEKNKLEMENPIWNNTSLKRRRRIKETCRCRYNSSHSKVLFFLEKSFIQNEIMKIW